MPSQTPIPVWKGREGRQKWRLRSVAWLVFVLAVTYAVAAPFTDTVSPSSNQTRGRALPNHTVCEIGSSKTKSHLSRMGAVMPAGVANDGGDLVRSIGHDSGAIHVPRV